jgi:chemotaxis protein MotB
MSGSAEKSSDAPIIIKRVRKGGHGHHGGAWKVAYADMVTALMALFIVLWILSQSDQTIRSVAGYFRDPIGFVDGGTSSITESGSQAGQITVMSGSQPSSQTTPLHVDEPDPRWRERARRIRGALAGSSELEKYQEQVEIAMTPAGLGITLLETADKPLFQPGEVKLNPQAAALLRTIGAQLSKVDNHLTIEGHTDGTSAGAGGRSNWEISTGRALAARQELEAGGFPPERVFEIRGLADRLLYNPLDPGDSRNRRISLTLLSQAAYRERLEQANDSALFDELLEPKRHSQ